MGQLLVTALGVMLLMSAGSTFALAMGAVGVLTWAAAHGHGLASFIRDPAAATSSYLSNVTAGQLAWDLFDFALTFIPGSAFGAGAHTIARTTARDMAATRTALRQEERKQPKPPNKQQPEQKPRASQNHKQHTKNPLTLQTKCISKDAIGQKPSLQNIPPNPTMHLVAGAKSDAQQDFSAQMLMKC